MPPCWRKARGRRLAPLALASVALAGGCALLGPGRPVPTACAVAGPGISASVSPENILAVTLSAPAPGADSARALYRVDDGPEQTTPWVAVVGPAALTPIVGLHERARLSARVQLSRAGATALSPGVTCVAGSLPDALRGIRLETRYGQRSGGYILTGLLRKHRGYAVAFDSLGRIAWYRDLGPAGSTGDVKQQPNGHITAWAGFSFGYQPDTRGRFLELLPTGEVVREYRAPTGHYTDAHELRLVFHGDSLRAAYLFGYDLRHVHVVRKGKLKPLAAHTLFRLEPSGAAVPVVSGWQLFTLADTVAAPHPDAPDFDYLLDEFNPATEEIAESVIAGVDELGIGYRMIMVRSLYRYEEP